MTTKVGQELVRSSGILLLLEWDSASTIAINTIKKCDRPLYDTDKEAALEL